MDIDRACKHKPPAELAGALYIHVPFCLAKCRYCDFYSLAGAAGQEHAYVAGIANELSARRDRLRRPLDSVFIGGGTPTCLPAEPLADLLACTADYIDDRTEFSIEANPATLTAEVADLLIAGGVNRVNIGVQSFIDAELKIIGRLHTAGQARQAIELCRRAGLDNIGLDLIFALPGQTLATWQESLDAALALAPAHLSCYGLTYEPHTPLAGDLAAGRVAQMHEDQQCDCYYAAVSAAGAGGLAQYEISNFARPGRQCAHNLTYWHNRPYVGLGPAAAGYLDGERWTNAADLPAWQQAVSAHQPAPHTSETLPPPRHMAETVMLALRLTEGIDRRQFARRFGVDVVAAFARPINRYAELGALELSPTHLRLSLQGLILADTVLADIIADAD